MEILLGIGIAVVLGLAGVGLAALRVFRWAGRETRGDAYFGRPAAEREALKTEMHRRGRWIVGLCQTLSRWIRTPLPSFEFRGVRGPSPICSAERFEFAASYQPDERDVFVATQMKCGTTWMQQVVYETLLHGKGDLSDSGHVHMYATSPWIEASSSVSMENAPRIGPDGLRIIKTHLPVSLCPYSEKAKYIYVLRHPVACFSSTVDFLKMLGGPMTEDRDEFVKWYCSDRMFWRSWPEHAEGWWQWSEQHSNVLFVHYEEMLEDLPAAVRRVAGFLGVSLADAEVAEVARKSGFEYMKEHEGVFEMAPPTVFSAAGAFLKSGRRDREAEGAYAERQQILHFCRERLRGGSYPAAHFYSDLA
jgi:hypothetical protein